MEFKPHSKCRVCGNQNLVKYLDLGKMPLSNNLTSTKDSSILARRYPLEVMFCDQCFLSQLSIVVDPELMFSNYVYRSSINGGYVRHCREMAKELQHKFLLTESAFMVDIAGNDGALLNEFKKQIGLNVLNVDPARNLSPICEDQGIPTIIDFWGPLAAAQILSDYGKADLVTATNVFAHVDNVQEFLRCVKTILKPYGVLVLEFPYIIDFIENNEFDTIYFEHLSYFSITPMVWLCENVGLKVIDVEKQDIHGGTVRVTIGLPHGNGVSTNVKDFIEQEFDKGFNNGNIYLKFGEKVISSAWKFKNGLASLRLDGNKIAGFAASAKGNTLLNYCGAGQGHIEYIVDQTPEKIGKYSPGLGLEIVDMERLRVDPPDYLVILSWNFKDEIIDKVSKVYSGKYIIPIPEFKIL